MISCLRGETKFSVDSTGFRISRFTDYFGEMHDKRRDHQWIKMHISCGVTTNVVTAVEVGGQNSADNNYFLPLSRRTHDNGFTIDEMSADKAYSARDNIIYIDSIGGTAYIPFKSNASGKPRGKAWI